MLRLFSQGVLSGAPVGSLSPGPWHRPCFLNPRRRRKPPSCSVPLYDPNPFTLQIVMGYVFLDPITLFIALLIAFLILLILPPAAVPFSYQPGGDSSSISMRYPLVRPVVAPDVHFKLLSTYNNLKYIIYIYFLKFNYSHSVSL